MTDTLKQMYFGQPTTPAMTFTSSTSGTNTNDATTFTTASVTLTSGRLYILTVHNTHGTSASAVSSITGGAGVPTFTSRGTTLYNTNFSRVTVLTAVPGSTYTGTLTLNFGGTTQTGALWSLVEVVGADTTSADGIVQAVTNTGTGTAASVTLTTPTTDAYNGVFLSTGGVNASFTAGTDFTEIHDVAHVSPTAALQTEYKYPFPASSATPSTTLNTSAAWGSIGLEIKYPTSGITIYTAPSGTGATAIIRNIQVCNTSGSSATFTLGIGGTVASKLLYSTFSVPSGGVHFANTNLVLTTGQVLQAVQGTSSALTAIISGVEL